MINFNRFILFCIILLSLNSYAEEMSDSAFKKILKTYLFVGDFGIKPETRSIGEEVFWRYPILIPKVEFPIDAHYFDENGNPIMVNGSPLIEQEFPTTQGSGRALEHLNRGRYLFIQGKYEEARKIWLSGKARFGKDYPWHRRNDYFIANGLMNKGLKDRVEKKLDWQDLYLKRIFSNSATFFSWAFEIKKDLPDPLLDRMTPKSLYNLAAIYFRYNKFSGGYAVAQNGINFLREKGRKEYRTEFNRMMAESFIINRSYLESVQIMDRTLRQDIDRTQAAHIFSRVGDIYFDLNNFELADDSYTLATSIDRESQKIYPSRFVLRGESLFWMGKYSQAQKMFHYALKTAGHRTAQENLNDNFAAVASIRIADSWMARKDYKKAKNAYFNHINVFRNHATSRDARIRLACLELPSYGGANIKHGRSMLVNMRKNAELNMKEKPKISSLGSQSKILKSRMNRFDKVKKVGGMDSPLAREAIELAWACEVGSYVQHDRTEKMLNRIRLFAQDFPRSRFLKNLIEPVRKYQASQFDKYLAQEKVLEAIVFFETNRQRLFSKISDSMKVTLFDLYMKTDFPIKAGEFWGYYRKARSSDSELLKLAVVATEMSQIDSTKSDLWRKRNQQMSKMIGSRTLNVAYSDGLLQYVDRIILNDSRGLYDRMIINLLESWNEAGKDLVCSHMLPTLSRMYQKNRTNKKDMEKIVDVFYRKYLSDALQFETYCGYAMLDFEARFFSSKPLKLYGKYKKRNYVPVSKETVHLFWDLAENLSDSGHSVKAEKLWKIIADKNDPALPETKLSKQRLNKEKGQFEQIWQ
tara:strand:+ start:90 stop:2522 length:2433 start_codon:yes stop_codon:yes gene_type:complete